MLLISTPHWIEVFIQAAILFPVFVSARETARRKHCVSNLKNLGLAINMYAYDWDGRSPRRHINDKQKYKGSNGTEGWLMRDKDWTSLIGGKPYLQTVHGVGHYSSNDGYAKSLQGVGSNVLLFDGSVTWRSWWDG